MAEEFLPGVATWYASDSPLSRVSAVFEDDGETGYFYACDRSGLEERVLDGVHIYNAASLRSSGPVAAHIIWSTDGEKAAFLLNGEPRAIIDFGACRSYSRSGSPSAGKGWQHGTWDESLMKAFEQGQA